MSSKKKTNEIARKNQSELMISTNIEIKCDETADKAADLKTLITIIIIIIINRRPPMT